MQTIIVWSQDTQNDTPSWSSGEKINSFYWGSLCWDLFLRFEKRHQKADFEKRHQKSKRCHISIYCYNGLPKRKNIAIRPPSPIYLIYPFLRFHLFHSFMVFWLEWIIVSNEQTNERSITAPCLITCYCHCCYYRYYIFRDLKVIVKMSDSIAYAYDLQSAFISLNHNTIIIIIIYEMILFHSIYDEIIVKWNKIIFKP